MSSQFMAKCSTKYCRGQRAPNRTVCYKCKAKKYKEKNPLRYKYCKLRSNAKRRGHTFTVSFEEFSELVLKSGYMEKSGRAANSYHLDRIDASRGYVPGNIQVLTNSINVQKWHYFEKEIGEEDLPF